MHQSALLRLGTQTGPSYSVSVWVRLLETYSRICQNHCPVVVSRNKHRSTWNLEEVD